MAAKAQLTELHKPGILLLNIVFILKTALKWIHAS